MMTQCQPLQNRLLTLMPQAEYQALLPHLELVALPTGSVVHETASRSQHAYFPTTAIISLLNETMDGNSTQIAAVGNDGMLGVELFMGGESTLWRAVVQTGGEVYRMPKRDIQHRFNEGGGLQHILLRYAFVLLAQMGQTSVCNRHHSLDCQLCRCLLYSIDRLPAENHELHMTHEMISNLLGVRREGVTQAASRLQHAGYIRYTRGRIRVLDRKALEARACECYRVIRHEIEQLFAYKFI